MNPIDQTLHNTILALAPAAQLVVHHQGKITYSAAFGLLDPDRAAQPVQPATRFDLASVTKLFTVTAFMRLVDQGQVDLETPLGAVLPEFQGERPIQPYEDPQIADAWVTLSTATAVDAGQLTFRHLLSHSSGLPAWRPLYRQPNADAARAMARQTFFSYPIGAQSIYSDIGLILLGFAVERLSDQRLDKALERLVCAPLGLTQSGFLPTTGDPTQPAPPSISEQCAATEFCAWRKRRIVGQVHDENAYRLNGIAGHAGLFSTAEDVAKLGQMYLDEGASLLRPNTVREMRRQQAQDGSARRGLGFAPWSNDPESTGLAFSASAFGHTGFTGTSLWIDPDRDLVVALLSNEVYNGRTNRHIGALRAAIHKAVVDAVDQEMA